jgi:hypothetical protein
VAVVSFAVKRSGASCNTPAHTLHMQAVHLSSSSGSSGSAVHVQGAAHAGAAQQCDARADGSRVGGGGALKGRSGSCVSNTQPCTNEQYMPATATGAFSKCRSLTMGMGGHVETLHGLSATAFASVPEVYSPQLLLLLFLQVCVLLCSSAVSACPIALWTPQQQHWLTCASSMAFRCGSMWRSLGVGGAQQLRD